MSAEENRGAQLARSEVEHLWRIEEENFNEGIEHREAWNEWLENKTRLQGEPAPIAPPSFITSLVVECVEVESEHHWEGEAYFSSSKSVYFWDLGMIKVLSESHYPGTKTIPDYLRGKGVNVPRA